MIHIFFGQGKRKIQIIFGRVCTFSNAPPHLVSFSLPKKCHSLLRIGLHAGKNKNVCGSGQSQDSKAIKTPVLTLFLFMENISCFMPSLSESCVQPTVSLLRYILAAKSAPTTLIIIMPARENYDQAKNKAAKYSQACQREL